MTSYNQDVCRFNADSSFGPTIDFASCQTFDFTLLFEQSILSIVPTSIFIILALARTAQLWNTSRKANLNAHSVLKPVIALLLLIIQIAWLILWIEANARNQASIPAAYLSVVASLLILPLSFLEHTRSVRPSSLLSIFLLFSSVLDIAQARTLFLISDGPRGAVLCTSIGVRLVLLVLESLPKSIQLLGTIAVLPLETTAGIFNRITFWWINRLFVKGRKGLISIEDLPDVDAGLESELLRNKFQRAWTSRSKPERSFELLWVACRAFKHALLSPTLPRLCLIGFQFSQPFLISRALNLLSGSETVLSRYEGYGLIGATFLIYSGIAVSTVQYKHRLFRSMTIFRGAIVGQIYDHAVEIGSDSHRDATAVTLMSVDVDRISNSIEHVHETWSSFVEVVIGTILLARQISWVCVFPLILVALSTYFSSKVAAQIGGRQKAWVNGVQKRTASTSSCLSSIKTLKMLGYAEIATSVIQQLRINELELQKGYRWMFVWLNTISNIPQYIAPAVVFAVYAIQAHYRGDGSLTTTQAFTSLALISLIGGPAATLLASVPTVAACSGCLERVQTFLLTPTRKDKRITNDNLRRQSVSSSSSQFSEKTPENVAILVKNARMKPSDTSEFVLENINLSVQRNTTVAISGTVGCGKSALLKAILGEIPCLDGSIQLSSHKIAYCAQNAWIPNQTIEQVIIGSSENDPAWLQRVLRACDLTEDLSDLSRGLQTIVGSKGSVLSGGQKQRIALARAIYSRCPIMILDDVLNAVDAKTEQRIAQRLFKSDGLLRSLQTTVVIVTHSGKLYIMRLYTIADRSDHLISYADSIVRMSDGSLSYETNPKKYLHATSIEAEETEEPLESKQPVKLEVMIKDRKVEDLTRQVGDISVYLYFFKNVSIASLLAYLVLSCVTTFQTFFVDVILKWWTEAGGHLDPRYLIPYCLLPPLTLGFVIGDIFFMLVVIAPQASKGLHLRLLNTVVSAPQSLFASIDRGSILNRFSQDMNLIDTSLAVAFLITSTQFITAVAQAGFISLASSYMAASLPFFFLALWAIQHIYLQTSRQLRYLDLEMKSPIYTHFLETLEGLTTIRAFAWTEEWRSENLKRLNVSQKPYYLLYCIQCWLNLVLDSTITVLAVIMVALALSFRDQTSPGLLGIALNNILIMNGNLSNLVTGWTQLETSLGAVARVKSFEQHTASESREGEADEPPESWPAHGRVDIQNLSTSYGSRSALKNISCSAQPGQKIGICGRTGSGKSTLLSALLRLIEVDSGSIKIDGVDLATLNRKSIRKSLIVIPQDTFLFPGTVRFNLDPLQLHPDEALVQALKTVHLWDILSGAGLDQNIDEEAFSRGQLQLFCIARAILKSSATGHKLILLDEATNSVDLQTDKLLQEVIRTAFSSHTVISVSHRLEALLNSDLIVVMADGCVVDIGSPKEIVEKPGAFNELYGKKSLLETSAVV